jgi:transposase
MSKAIVYAGVDVGKDELWVAMTKRKPRKFDNTKAGVKALVHWCRKVVGDATLHVCMEATGVHSSGGETRYGRLRNDVNRYLKWAFVEAANTISLNRKHWPDRHVVRLYNRLKHRRGHVTAIGALARHLAESTYWILTKKEKYRDPNLD